ncbi:unnamed protein product [Cutaneotrichosporon oleaginosum]
MPPIRPRESISRHLLPYCHIIFCASTPYPPSIHHHHYQASSFSLASSATPLHLYSLSSTPLDAYTSCAVQRVPLRPVHASLSSHSSHLLPPFPRSPPLPLPSPELHLRPPNYSSPSTIFLLPLDPTRHTLTLFPLVSPRLLLQPLFSSALCPHIVHLQRLVVTRSTLCSPPPPQHRSRSSARPINNLVALDHR